MRLLIYGMQSSGASAFCYFLAQRPECIALVDIWGRSVAPYIDSVHPVVAKATVTMTRTLAEQIASFRPDRTILFMRDPVAVYASLRNYDYGNRFGSIEEKLARFDAAYSEAIWDEVIQYEDFAVRDSKVVDRVNNLGWECHANYWNLARSRSTIRDFNAAKSTWCRDHFGDGWGFGNLRDEPVTPKFVARPDDPNMVRLVASVAPAVSDLYARRSICRNFGSGS